GEGVLRVDAVEGLLDGVRLLPVEVDVLVRRAEEAEVVDPGGVAPVGVGGRLDLAVTRPELELVRQAAGVEEVGGVGLHLLLRPRCLVQQVGVVPDAAGGAVEVSRGGTTAAGEAALGNELEAAVDPGVETGEIEVRGEDLGVLDLVGVRRVAESALVPS